MPLTYILGATVIILSLMLILVTLYIIKNRSLTILRYKKELQEWENTAFYYYLIVNHVDGIDNRDTNDTQPPPSIPSDKILQTLERQARTLVQGAWEYGFPALRNVTIDHVYWERVDETDEIEINDLYCEKLYCNHESILLKIKPEHLYCQPCCFPKLVFFRKLIW